MTSTLEDRAVAQLRIPPSNVDAERQVIGSLLLDSQAMGRIDLKPEEFYRHEHIEIYRAMQALAAAGKSTEPVSVCDWMRARGQDPGGMLLVELGQIALEVSSSAAIKRYAEIVREKSLLRGIIVATDEIATEAFNTQGKSPAEVLDGAQMKFAKLATVRAKREPQHITASLADYLQLLQDMSEGKNPAIPTGIAGLDRILNGGLRRGELMVIGARPKHGKTALTLTMARNIAHRHGVLFISQEMPVSQLMHRHTAAMGSVDLGRVLRADPRDTDMWECVREAAHRLGELYLVHDDQSAQSLMDVRRKAVKVKREYGLDVLFVDFLQLMQGAGEDNRNRELDVIANGIKALAMDLDCAVVLLSQMSRKADEHYGRPTMTHLRDSGAIEAAADQVCVLFTDHAHPLSQKTPNFAGYSELEMVAHRNGPQGLVPLQFLGQYQQIADWEGRMPERPMAKSAQRGMD